MPQILLLQTRLFLVPLLSFSLIKADIKFATCANNPSSFVQVFVLTATSKHVTGAYEIILA